MNTDPFHVLWKSAMHASHTEDNNKPRIQIETPETIMMWLERGEAILIDVREEHEYHAEHIPGSVLIPLSRFDPSDFPDTTGKKLVLHCRSGQRCGIASGILAAAGFSQDLFRMEGGILNWVQKGGKTRHSGP